jgi:hypothetical protein
LPLSISPPSSTIRISRAFPAGLAPGLVALGLLLATGCGKSASFHRAASEELEAAITPSALAMSLRRTGGGHFHAVTTFEISPGENPDKPEGPLETIVTTTDVWMDKNGQYRLVENNDKDGGREVVLHGRELAVGLKYGRLIKRTARDPEPARLLEDGLGGPWAIWEMARRFAEVDRREDRTTGSPTVLFPLQKADSPQPVKASFGSASPLRAWRDTVGVDTLSGAVRLDPSGAFISTRMDVVFSLRRDGKPFYGAARVEAFVKDRGKVNPIPPPRADELVPRQRTILEERALLGRAGSSETSARPTRSAR